MLNKWSYWCPESCFLIYNIFSLRATLKLNELILRNVFANSIDSKIEGIICIFYHNTNSTKLTLTGSSRSCQKRGVRKHMGVLKDGAAQYLKKARQKKMCRFQKPTSSTKTTEGYGKIRRADFEQLSCQVYHVEYYDVITNSPFYRWRNHISQMLRTLVKIQSLA